MKYLVVCGHHDEILLGLFDQAKSHPPGEQHHVANHISKTPTSLSSMFRKALVLGKPWLALVTLAVGAVGAAGAAGAAASRCH